MTSKNWISIADKMPMDGDHVLVWNDYIFAGRWEHGNWLCDEDSSIEGVTHWMPAPAPPGKITSPTDILRKVMGEWTVVDLVGRDFDDIWEELKDRKPFYENCSLHVIEAQYEYRITIYHVCWNISYEKSGFKDDKPDSIGIRTYYNWDKK